MTWWAPGDERWTLNSVPGESAKGKQCNKQHEAVGPGVDYERNLFLVSVVRANEQYMIPAIIAGFGF
mgnify:CR=1 FL=1